MGSVTLYTFPGKFALRKKESFVANVTKKKKKILKTLVLLIMDFEVSIWKYQPGEKQEGNDEGYNLSDVQESRRCIPVPRWGNVLTPSTPLHHAAGTAFSTA